MKMKNNHDFSDKMILNQWVMSLLGIDTLSGETAQNHFRKLIQPFKKNAHLEGISSNGLHHYYNILIKSRYYFNKCSENNNMIKVEKLLEYENNIISHTKNINSYRERPIVWKYFQWLTLMFVEIFLDRYFTDKQKLFNDLNNYVSDFNAAWQNYNPVPLYEIQNLNKICIQNATGSGKTLIMHVNIHQFMHYANKNRKGKEISRTILLTANENLSNQHLNEFYESGFVFAERLNPEITGSIEQIDVTEITKLKEEKGLTTLDTDSLGDQNFLLVDEGHRGLASGNDNSKWLNRRNRLYTRGFAIEYSATFEQALTNSDSLDEQYGKAILFDYSYRWFHEDGYGKDYHITNYPKRRQTLSDDNDVYMCACLLIYYQQLKLYNDKRQDFMPFNIEKPLWTFVGNTVSSRKEDGRFKDVKLEYSDVETIIFFFARFLHEGDAFKRNIKNILKGGGESGLFDTNGLDIFKNSFPYILSIFTAEQNNKIYEDIIKHVFNSETSGNLILERLVDDSGEITMHCGNPNKPFGLINVGDPIKLSKNISKNISYNNMISVEESHFKSSLFVTLNDEDSNINLLIGSRKFNEGWDSWRVSTMGLMNVGRGRGARIIQTFGRGVRLKGHKMSLKRSSHVDITKPNYIELLETLNVFGVNADYMNVFKEELEEQGMKSDTKITTIEIKMNVRTDFSQKDLKVLEVKEKENGNIYDYNQDGNLILLKEVPMYIKTHKVMLDYYSQLQSVRSATSNGEINRKNEITIHKDMVALLDIDQLYFDLLNYKNEQNMLNLVFDKKGILNLLKEKTWYTLYVPQYLVNFNTYKDIEFLQRMVAALLKKYILKYYNYHNNIFLNSKIEARNLDINHEVMPKNYKHVFTIEEGDGDLLAQLKELKNEIETNKNDFFKFNNVAACNFNRHLYQPLFFIDSKNKVQVIPKALVKSEFDFVCNLRDWCDNNKTHIEENSIEIYLLRNKERGSGIKFFNEGYFYPDFILWILKNDVQYIHFIEPHGLVHEGPDSEKILFYKTIKNIEKRINDPKLILNSWVLSATEKDKLEGKGKPVKLYEDNQVLFMYDDENYLDNIIGHTGTDSINESVQNDEIIARTEKTEEPEMQGTHNMEQITLSTEKADDLSEVIDIIEMYKKDQKDLYDYVLKYVKKDNKFEVKTRSNDRYIACFPKNAKTPYPVLASHLDVYNKLPPDEVREDNGFYKGYRNGEKSILSGDDRNGVWTMLKLIEAGNTDWGYIFSKDEEIGRKGAKDLVNDNIITEYDKRISYFIQIDGPGDDGLTYYSLVEKRGVPPFCHNNQEFIKKLKSFPKYKVDHGGKTDMLNYSQKTKICSINISAGYFEQHRPNRRYPNEHEHSLIEYVENLPKVLEELIKHLGTKQYLIEDL